MYVTLGQLPDLKQSFTIHAFTKSNDNSFDEKLFHCDCQTGMSQHAYMLLQANKLFHDKMMSLTWLNRSEPNKQIQGKLYLPDQNQILKKKNGQFTLQVDINLVLSLFLFIHLILIYVQLFLEHNNYNGNDMTDCLQFNIM